MDSDIFVRHLKPGWSLFRSRRDRRPMRTTAQMYVLPTHTRDELEQVFPLLTHTRIFEFGLDLGLAVEFRVARVRGVLGIYSAMGWLQAVLSLTVVRWMMVPTPSVCMCAQDLHETSFHDMSKQVKVVKVLSPTITRARLVYVRVKWTMQGIEMNTQRCKRIIKLAKSVKKARKKQTPQL